MISDKLHSSTPTELSQRFWRDGYAVLDSLTTAEDLARVRQLLDPLFAQFDSLGDRAFDLAASAEPGAAPKSPEINEAAVLEPALRETLTFKRCREIAHDLMGVPVGYQFDHAIFKTPHNQSPTAWHQDEAYNHEPIPLHSIHFWIPLQPATEENGCMWFIPGSHLQGMRPHHVVSRRAKGGTLAVDACDTERAVVCPLPVGGATIHHPLTLHYTGPNQSDDYRRAWILHFGAFGKWRHKLHIKAVAAKFRNWLPGGSSD